MQHQTLRKQLIAAAALVLILVAFTQCKSDKSSEADARTNANPAAASDRPAPGASASLTVPPSAEDIANSANRPASDPTWPSDMPSIVPRPDGVKLSGYNRTTVDGKETWTVVISEGKVSDLGTFEGQLKGLGFKTNVMAGEKGGVLNAKKDNVVVTMTLSEEQKQLVVARGN